MAKRKRLDECEQKAGPTRKSPRATRLGRAAVNVNKEDPNSGSKAPNDRSSDHDPDHGRTLRITEQTGDLFTAPDHTVLIHACNCEGHWGKGIAAQFKKRYSAAFSTYKARCENHDQADLRGTALLIPPAEEVSEGDRHLVGCLFTSLSKGRSKDKPAEIVRYTETAMKDLLRQISAYHESHESKIEQIWMCKINSGLFGVPWEDSKAALERVEVPDGVPRDVVVMSKD